MKKILLLTVVILITSCSPIDYAMDEATEFAKQIATEKPPTKVPTKTARPAATEIEQKCELELEISKFRSAANYYGMEELPDQTTGGYADKYQIAVEYTSDDVTIYVRIDSREPLRCDEVSISFGFDGAPYDSWSKPVYNFIMATGVGEDAARLAMRHIREDMPVHPDRFTWKTNNDTIGWNLHWWYTSSTGEPSHPGLTISTSWMVIPPE